jgi:hypothetical protein
VSFKETKQQLSQLFSLLTGRANSAEKSAVQKIGDRAQTLSLEAAVKNTLADVQLVHLGDTDHRTNGVHAWLARPETMQALKEAGVKVIFLEELKALQPLGDAVAEGKIAPEDFVPIVKSLGVKDAGADTDSILGEHAKAIVNAQAAGIKVCFADVGDGNSELASFNEEFVKAGLGSIKEFMELSAWGKMKKMAKLDKAQAEKITELSKAFVTARIDDRPLGEIVARELGDGKGLIIYGDRHNAGTLGLGRLLTEKGVSSSKISVVADENAIALNMSRFSDPENATDRVYALGGSRLYDLHPSAASGPVTAAGKPLAPAMT